MFRDIGYKRDFVYFRIVYNIYYSFICISENEENYFILIKKKLMLRLFLYRKGKKNYELFGSI